MTVQTPSPIDPALPALLAGTRPGRASGDPAVEGGVEPVLQLLLERLPVPLGVSDRTGAISYANAAFMQVFGLEPVRIDGIELGEVGGQAAALPATVTGRDGRTLQIRTAAVPVAERCVLVFEREPERGAAEGDWVAISERVAELEVQALTDPLTGLWNRRQFERMAQIELARTARSRQPVSLIMFDIDHFKRINDRFGHVAGDTLLRTLAGFISARIRDTDLLFRWGGEEFVILASGTGYRGTHHLADKLRAHLAQVDFPDVGRATASFGVAEHLPKESLQAWVERVDRALYAAKAHGRNRVEVDERGESDFWRGTQPPMQLSWQEAYACGEPDIDRGHRALFATGNALIAAAAEPQADPTRWRQVLDQLFAQLESHFDEEDRILTRAGFEQIAQHRAADREILDRARELERAVAAERARPGDLLQFLLHDVISGHMLERDREFFPLFTDFAAPDRTGASRSE